MAKLQFIKNYDENELSEICSNLGYPKFHGTQIFKWIFQKSCNSISDMTDIPLSLKNDLNESYKLSSLSIENYQKSKIDNTTKFLLKTYDDQFIESVSMIEDNRHTICLSSQIGCNVDCDFCATGKMGLTRNLSISEIIEQLLIISNNINKRITNIVFMGMGEPFLNYSNVIKACYIFSNPKAFNLSTKRITISTAGILPKINRYITEKHKFKLAISLNASNDQFRESIMPINKKWPIKNLLSSIEKYNFSKHRIIMFEYVLLKDLNDSAEDALNLSKLVKNINCKINLIPFNEIFGKYKRPSNEKIKEFSEILYNNRGKYRVLVRWSKGEDINAACGQLATKFNE